MGHAVYQKICPGIKKDGPPDLVGPEVIMGDPPQAGLDPAQNKGNRGTAVSPNQVCIGNDRPVRPAIVDAAGGVIISYAVFCLKKKNRLLSTTMRSRDPDLSAAWCFSKALCLNG